MGDSIQVTALQDALLQEAFYLNDGLATQEGPYINVNNSGDIYQMKPSLTFNIKTENLTTYLQNFAQVMNQHAILLNQMRELMKQQVAQDQLVDVLTKLSEKTRIPNETFNQKLKQITFSAYNANYGDTSDVLKACSKLSNGQMDYGSALDFLFRKVNELEKRNDTLKDNFNNRFEKVEADLELKSYKNDLNSLDEKLNEFAKQNQNNLKEQDTKLKDQENKLSERIKSLEGKTLKEIKDLVNKLDNVEGQQSNLAKETFLKLKDIEQELNEKTAHSRKLIKDIDDLCKKKVDVNIYEVTIKDLTVKVQLFQQQSQERLKHQLSHKNDQNNSQYNEKFNEIENKVTNINNAFTELKVQLEEICKIKDLSDDNGKKTLKGLDNAHLQDIEQAFTEVKTQIKSNHNLIKKIERDLDNKIDFEKFKLDLERKMDKDELMQTLEGINNDSEKMKKVQKEIEDLNKRLEIFSGNLEKKFNKLRKQLDVNGLMRQIKAKADTEDVKNELGSRDDKINNMENTVTDIRKELDNLSYNFKRYVAALNSQKKQYESALLRTSSISPHICLSCGRGLMDYVTFLPMSNIMKGTDNKYYQVDNGKANLFPIDEFGMRHENSTMADNSRNLQEALRSQSHCSHPHPIASIKPQMRLDKKNRTLAGFRKTESVAIQNEDDISTKENNNNTRGELSKSQYQSPNNRK